MRKMSKACKSVWQIAIVLLLTITTSCGGPGFLGLQDYQRDFLMGGLPALLAGGALAAALLLPGAPGATGPAGPAGSGLFDVQVQDFYNQQRDASGGLAVPNGDGIVRITEPAIGLATEGVAYRIMIPETYGGVNPIVMRLSFQRTPVTVPGAGFFFNVFASRLVNGSGAVEAYISPNPPVRTFTPTPPALANGYIVLDLPLYAAVPDGLGGAALAAGDLVAFELDNAGTDGGLYTLLAVEFYETTTPPAAGALGGTIS